MTPEVSPPLAAIAPVAPGRPWIGIAALSENRVIGDAGRIPWHLPADFAWFKSVTRGQILVMGRKTFESIGRALPGRRTIVVSGTGRTYPGAETVSDLTALGSLVREDQRLVFVCGGAVLYQSLLPHCGDLFLTHVRRHVDGDAYFPPFEGLFERLADVMETPDFRVTHYVRRCGH